MEVVLAAKVKVINASERIHYTRYGIMFQGPTNKESPHIGPRKKKALRNSLATPRPVASSPDRSGSNTVEQATPSPYVLHDPPHACTSSLWETRNRLSESQPNLIHGSDSILETTNATHLPPPPMIQALKDFYFNELFPLVPVLDRQQTERETSILLQQCLCFAGSTMRQSNEPAKWSSSAIYGRIKTLLFLRHDPDPFNMLTTLCILGTWLPYSADAIVLDSPWQWTGMAIRLAIQLHLHEKETYQHLQRPKTAVRIWWYLFNNDTLQMACTGCPGMFPIEETRIPPPELSDFDAPDTGAQVFCGLVALCKLLRKVLELGRSDKTSKEEVQLAFTKLAQWKEQLPTELRLFDQSRTVRQPYNRLVLELHIFYLVTSILTFFLGRRDNPPLFKYASMAASSCISRLYEEILFHEDVKYLLPIHSWANLVAAIPRTFSDNEFFNPELAEEGKICQKVLEKIGEKHTSAALVQSRIATLSVSATVFNSPPIPLPEQDRQYLIEFFDFPAGYCSMLSNLHLAPAQNNDQIETFAAENAADEWEVDWSSFIFDGSMGI